MTPPTWAEVTAARQTDPSGLPLPEAAAWYAAQGCRVFPLPPGSKAAKLPGWQDKASDDADMVFRWWAEQPEANIGVLCGGPFDVVDLDGPDARDTVRHRFGDVLPPVLGWVETPRGWHGWIPATGERRRIGVLDHVDYLGTGGYVVAAPSVVDRVDEATGEVVAGRYRWTEPPTLDLDPAPDCSGWSVLLAKPEPVPLPAPSRQQRPGTTAYGSAVLADEAAQVAATAPGGRNDRLNRAAFRVGQLVPHEISEADARQDLAEAARACGLTVAEAEATLRSGLRKGATSPRQPAQVKHDVSPSPEVAKVRSNFSPAPEVGPMDPPEPEVLQGATPAPEGEAGDLVDRLALDELRKLRARHLAREWFDAERQPEAEAFDAGTLAEVLARPAEPLARVEGLIPWEASTLVVAQRKTGKTTLVLNLARCLLTGEPFLGNLGVRPVTGTVAVLNFEVSGAQLGRWAHEAGVPADRLFLVNLRGRRNPLNHTADRHRLAGLLRGAGVESLIVDPFGRAFPGKDQNATGEVSSWLVGLDEFARAEVGARDLVLCTHAGWNGERTRGASALEDWPDSIITLTRDESETGNGERYLRAMGRDVDLDEDRLDFNPDTRQLTLAGAGNRKQAAQTRRLDDLVSHVVDIVTETPTITGAKVAEALRRAEVPHQKGDHSKALAQAVAAELLTVQPGPRGAKCYTLTPPTPTYPDLPQRGTSSPTPTPPYRGGVGDRGMSTPDLPQPCRVCGQPLHPAVAADGFTTCPSCEVTR